MNVCFDSYIFSYQKYGGISVHFASIIKELIDRNFRIYFLANKKQYEKLASNIHLMPVIDHLNFIVIENNFVKYSLLKRNNIDIIHLTYYGFRIYQNKNIPIISTFHDPIPEIYLFKIKLKYLPLVILKFLNLWSSKGVCFVSNYSFKAFSKYYFLIKILKRQTYAITYNSHNLSKEPAKVNFYLDSNLKKSTHLFLYVGKRGGYKNFNNIIKSIKRLNNGLNNSIFNPGLVIVGGGALNAFEKKLLYGLNYLKLPTINSHLYSLILSKVDCLLHPSLYEGFGITVLEALASKCDVIAFKSEAVYEIAQEAIFYFKENNIESIYSIIYKYIMNFQEKRMQRNVGVLRSKEFTWAGSTNNLINLYSKLIK